MQRNIFKLIAASAVATFAFQTTAFARDSMLDISVNGMQQRDQYESGIDIKESLGIELGIPITQYFQISLGYAINRETFEYSIEASEYKRQQAAVKYCSGGTNTDSMACVAEYVNGEKYIDRKLNTDITTNASFGYQLGLWYPSFFFGKLWRTTNVSNSIEKGEDSKNPTWNAGVAMQVYLTYKLRFKASYRISPSTISSPSSRKFDTLMTLGFTYSL